MKTKKPDNKIDLEDIDDVLLISVLISAVSIARKNLDRDAYDIALSYVKLLKEMNAK